jgi:hypothetical protein
LNTSSFSTYLGGDLVEMDSHHSSVHFSLRTVDPDLLDKAVDVLQGDGTIDKVIRDDVMRNM